MTPTDHSAGNAHRLARNVFNLLMGQISTTALTMIMSAAIARTLGPADFGVLYLVTAVSTFAYVFVDWGHGAYVIREIARHPERAGELMGSVLGVRAATAVALSIPAVLIGWLLGYPARTLVYIAALMAAWIPVYLGLTFGWAFRGKERMEFDALINVALKLLILIVGVTLLVRGAGIGAVIVANAAAGTLTLVVAWVLYRRLDGNRLRFAPSIARELMVGGAPMVTMTIAVALQPYIDANMLSRLSTPTVLGWYSAAMMFASTLIAPAFVLASAAYPRLSIAASNHDEFRTLLHDALRPLLFVAVLGAAGTFLFAHVAIDIVYSMEKYGQSATILRAFTPAMVLVFIDMMLGTAILAAGNAVRLAGAKILSIVVIAGLEVVLIPYCQARFGNGAIAVMLSFAVGELVMVAAAIRLLPRGTVHAGIAMDLARAVAAGVGTVLLMRPLIELSPFVAIPLSIVMFTGLAVAVRLIRPSDLAAIRRLRKAAPAGAPEIAPAVSN